MLYSTIALAALAAAQVASGVQSSAPEPAPTAQVESDSATDSTVAATSEHSAEPTAQVPNAANVVAPSVQRPLALTCVGGGTANKVRGALINGGSGWASVTSHHDRQFNDQVDIRLFSGDDRIRLPRTMLPGLHGGQEGWFKLKNVAADTRSIRAKAAVNFMNNPNVFIDRVTGTISISGKAGDYSGQCAVIDTNAPAKF